MTAKKVLSIEKLTKKFNEFVAVDNVSFDVQEGEILGIIGSNGSGKTTLFNMISGVLEPTSGSIFAEQQSRYSLFDFPALLKTRFSKKVRWGERTAVDIGGQSPHIVLNKFGIARTFQIVKPFKQVTTLENVTIPHIPQNFFAKPSTLKSRAIRSLLSVDLGEKQKYPAVILPHGDLKRLDFARAMATNPRLLLLDEPFGGLSSQDAFRVTQLIKNANKEYGVTIMIVEHKLKLLSNLVTRIVVLDHGQVIAMGTPKEISKNKDVIEAYLGVEADHIA